MLNELLFTLFLTQVGTVAVITACIVGAMALFYAETNALDKCDAEKPLEDLGKSVVRIKNFGFPHPPRGSRGHRGKLARHRHRGC